jgi:hypothetical protein
MKFEDVSLGGPSSTSKQRIDRSENGQFPRGRFYRGGFQTNGLQTLCSRTLISISCNVALGEPKLRNTIRTFLRDWLVSPVSWQKPGRSQMLPVERSRDFFLVDRSRVLTGDHSMEAHECRNSLEEQIAGSTAPIEPPRSQWNARVAVPIRSNVRFALLIEH